MNAAAAIEDSRDPGPRWVESCPEGESRTFARTIEGVGDVSYTVDRRAVTHTTNNN